MLWDSMDDTKVMDGYGDGVVVSPNIEFFVGYMHNKFGLFSTRYGFDIDLFYHIS